ncbi:hypothetical protein L195_g007583 [Trifolium pratense]|uniref:Uncharacterized protein n=1 Tax=Trifolium pratense TaxID=57577 RepID=A0A2K3P6S7_TRIPR|nr:hypothetical protein L195_g007583 [Trifolium pratense]
MKNRRDENQPSSRGDLGNGQIHVPLLKEYDGSQPDADSGSGSSKSTRSDMLKKMQFGNRLTASNKLIQSLSLRTSSNPGRVVVMWILL